MLKKFMYVVTLLAFSLSMIAAAPAATSNVTRALKGTIVAIDTKTRVLTVAPLTGKVVKIKVASSTKVKRQGKSSSFAKLRVGDKTSLHYNSDTKQATDIDDSISGYEIHGTVESVDVVANTIVVASEEGGNSVKLNVNASTVIKSNGAAATLTDLVVGEKVEAKYSSATMLASLIKTETEDSDFHGTITALNFAGNTVTITPDLGGADVVLRVVASTVFINNDETVIAFTGLHVGDPVEAAHDSVTMIASKIEIDY